MNDEHVLKAAYMLSMASVFATLEKDRKFNTRNYSYILKTRTLSYAFLQVCTNASHRLCEFYKKTHTVIVIGIMIININIDRNI